MAGLTEEEKARIRAEEEYRAQIRTQMPQPSAQAREGRVPRMNARMSGWKALGIIVVFFVLAMFLVIVATGSLSQTPPQTKVPQTQYDVITQEMKDFDMPATRWAVIKTTHYPAELAPSTWKGIGAIVRAYGWGALGALYWGDWDEKGLPSTFATKGECVKDMNREAAWAQKHPEVGKRVYWCVQLTDLLNAVK